MIFDSKSYKSENQQNCIKSTLDVIKKSAPIFSIRKKIKEQPFATEKIIFTFAFLKLKVAWPSG